MKKLIILALVFVAVSASAASMVKARMVEVNQPTNIAPGCSNLAAWAAWVDDNFPTNIVPTNVYPTLADVTNLVSTSSVPGTNIIGATYSNGVWTVDASTTVLTNESIVRLFTTITNGAPILVQYLSLTSTASSAWGYPEGTDPTWSGTEYHAITTWVEEASSGAGLVFTSGSTVSIPTGHVALTYFQGALKDGTTNRSGADTVVTFRYTPGDSDNNSGTMFYADREDSDDPKDVQRSTDARMFPPTYPDVRTLRVQAKHDHGYTVTNSATKDRPIRWQILLLQTVGD